jgi:TolB protein
MKRLFLKLIAMLSLCSVLPLAQGQLKVDISGVGANQIPISIAGFINESVSGQTLSSIIRADLERSGMFRLIDTQEAIAEDTAIDLPSWKSKGADALAIGSAAKLSDGRIEIRYKLIDTVRGATLTAQSLIVQQQFARLGAHRVADDIFEKLTGIRGAFATRIAYVSRSGGEYRLEIADSDGENAFIALRSSEPIISPTWSPDGSRLAYVSFESKKPVVYVQELASRKRVIAANFKGSNSAPAWSPDSRRLAIALSRDGLTQIYSVSADGSDLRKLTHSNGIDTEPCYSPDGQSIYFTSDRSGGPQIYRVNADGGDLKRVTFGGNYNISPSISPDGKMLAYISRREGKFQLHLLDLASSREMRLSDAALDESPSFAPNGRYILYATEAGGRGSLAVASIDGSAKYTLSARASNLREPAWGPFTK